MEEVAASKRSLEHRQDWKDVNLPTKTKEEMSSPVLNRTG